MNSEMAYYFYLLFLSFSKMILTLHSQNGQNQTKILHNKQKHLQNLQKD